MHNIQHVIRDTPRGRIVSTINKNIFINIDSKRYMFIVKNKDTIRTFNNIPFLLEKIKLKVGYIFEFKIDDDIILKLHDLGYETMGLEPIHWSYNFPLLEGKYVPFLAQRISAGFMALHERCYNTSQMRTGKTGSVIYATDYLRKQGKVNGVVIIAPVSTMDSVWRQSISLTLPDSTIAFADGRLGSAKRKELFNGAYNYYIINYEGIKVVYKELLNSVKNRFIDMIVIDELTNYGSTTSGNYKALYNIINTKKKYANDPIRVIGITGSVGSDPEKVYSFASMVNPNKMFTVSRRVWMEKTMNKIPLGNTGIFKYEPKSGSEKIIKKTLQPNICVDKKEVFVIPPVKYIDIVCPLTDQQQKLYNEINEYRLTLIEQEEQNIRVEATTKSALIHKLFQIALGVLKTNNDGEHNSIILDNTPRIEAIKKIIDGTSSKVVIFSAYVGVIDHLINSINKMGYTVAKVDGSVSGRERTKIFDDFNNKPSPHILVCHPRTTAYGVDLAVADTMIFNGVPLSGGFIYTQALDRLSSCKQQSDCIKIYHLISIPEERYGFKQLNKQVSTGIIIRNMFIKSMLNNL